MDYEETFVPIAKMTSVRTLIAIASVRQWCISQLDVKNVFLNGDLQEEVYIEPPLSVSHDFGYVCKLKKALYDLKQAPRAWFEKFFVVISALGFFASSYDSALFVKCIDAGRIILSLYVDDMIIISDNVDDISILKADLAKQFEMKDLSPLQYFLGIEVVHSLRDFLLSQSKYVIDIPKQARLTDNKVVDTSIDVNEKHLF